MYPNWAGAVLGTVRAVARDVLHDVGADAIAAGSARGRSEAEIRALYQPIVDLETGAVLGYEALARGPEGTPLESPLALLDDARRTGRLRDVDWQCRVAALEGALDADMGSSLTLFINVAADCDDPLEVVPAVHDAVIERANRELRVVLEVTEQAIVERPASLLRLVDWARSRSWGIALDDIGADPDSLAIMPFLEPDVVKLDLRLVHEQSSPDVGNLVSAVLAQAERTGAQIVAEGIESEAHKSTALALGATLGQGWLFGRPAALPHPLPTPPRAIELQRLPPDGNEVTPFSIVRAARPLRRGAKQLLVDLSSHLEEQAVSWHDNPVIISTFGPDEPLLDEFLARYAVLASQGSFVAVIGAAVPEQVERTRGRIAGGVHTVALDDGHRLGEEWSVIVVGPHYAGALVARQVDDDVYDFAVTHDRRLTVEAGRSLLRRLDDGRTD